MAKSEILGQIREGVISGNKPGVEELCNKALEEGVPAGEILNDGLLDGMTEVGERFQRNEFYVPEMLVAARAMKAGMAVLESELAKTPAQSRGKVVLGTVSGDLHDIGKNLAGIMMSAAGFDVVDLGTDVSSEKFVEAAMKDGVVAVGMSALLTTTMPGMGNTIEALRSAGFKGKVIIGGAPITGEFAEKIGADLYGSDAAEGASRLKAAV